MGHFRQRIEGIVQAERAEQASEIQVGAGREALEFGAEQVGPFRDVGIEASGLLGGATLGEEFAAPEFQGFNLDPSRVTNNPLFQALQQEQTQNLIGRNVGQGLGGSGGVRDAIARNTLLLGAQFQDRDINQQQLGFQNQNQEFQNQLQANQARFGQIFDRTRLGANAASQLATSGQGILQGIGNSQAAGIIGAGNALTGIDGSQTAGVGSAIGLVGGLLGGGNPVSGLFG